MRLTTASIGATNYFWRDRIWSSNGSTLVYAALSLIWVLLASTGLIGDQLSFSWFTLIQWSVAGHAN